MRYQEKVLSSMYGGDRYNNYCFTIESLDNHGVLLLWDCSMPHVKGTFADMIKEQNQYR